MAATFSQLLNTVVGNKRLVVTEVTFDASYATGGEAFTPANVGLNVFDAVLVEQPSGYFVQFDRANNKLIVRSPQAAIAAHSHTENTAATYTQNATTVTGGAITAAAGAEVVAATDLSTLKAVVVTIGT